MSARKVSIGKQQARRRSSNRWVSGSSRKFELPSTRQITHKLAHWSERQQPDKRSRYRQTPQHTESPNYTHSYFHCLRAPQKIKKPCTKLFATCAQSLHKINFAQSTPNLVVNKNPYLQNFKSRLHYPATSKSYGYLLPPSTNMSRLIIQRSNKGLRDRITNQGDGLGGRIKREPEAEVDDAAWAPAAN